MCSSVGRAEEAGDSGSVAVCPAGQVVSATTAGHCCWPEQVWSSLRSACVGDPRCPEGYSADGERCTPAAVTSPPPSRYGPPPSRYGPPPTAPPAASTPPLLTPPPSYVAPSPMPQAVIPAATIETRTAYRRPRLGRAGYIWGSLALVLGAADVGLGGYLVSVDTSFARRGAAGLVCVLSGVIGVGLGIAGLATAGRPEGGR
jgi:hypothetical protein